MKQIFEMVLTMSITSAYVFAAVLILRLFLRKAPKVLSYLAWFAVWFRLLCPVTLQSVLSLIPRSDIAEIIPRQITGVVTPENIQLPSVIPSEVSSPDSAVVISSDAPSFSVFDAIPYIWLTVVLALIIYEIVAFILTKRRISSAFLTENNIYESDRITSPFVFGIINPKIYLPLNLSEAEKACIIPHEQTHIRRRDYIIKPLAFFAVALHWFNPVVWISFFLMVKDMEMSCDESVIKNIDINARKTYSSTLLNISLKRSGILGPISFGKSSTKSRIKNVLSYKRPVFWVSVIAIVTLIVFVIGMSLNPPKDSAGEPREPNEQTIDVITEETESEPVSAEDTEDTESVELLDNASADPLTFVNTQAEELFNTIISNRSVWEREEMDGATLLDLDFDGQPEFLLSYPDNDIITAVYKFDENSFYEWFLIENVFDMVRRISLYTDEQGNKGWVLPTSYNGDGYYEDRMTFYNYTVEPFSEMILLASRHYFTETNEETIYGDVEYFMNGSEFSVTETQVQSYINADRDTLEWWAPPQTKEEALKYCYTKEYIHFTEEVLNPTTYSLAPGYYWWVYDDPANENYSPHSILKPISLLVNAYISNDYEFFSGFYSYGAAFKPVIYLYPEEETDVNVRVTFPHGGDFTCTYPDYNSGWNVTAYPDGTLIDKANGNEYYCLYWEGSAPFDWDFSSGFVVKGSDTAQFLREKLLYMGLNQRECNEFIIYWLPLMQGNPYNLISFQTSAYTDKAAMNVTPGPDSVLRIFMAYTPIEKPMNIPEQQLNSFERTGFSVIEWGGTCVE